MDGFDILDRLNENRESTISFDFSNLLKLPVAVILFGNILYSFLVVLKVRILTDTFESTDKKTIKMLAYVYLFVITIGSLLSLLFIILG